LDSKCGRYWFFKWFLLLKVQINSQKNQVLKGKISWERGNTLRLTIQFKHDFLSYLVVQKIQYMHCKTMFTCWVSLICNGFTLGPTTQATIVIIIGREGKVLWCFVEWPITCRQDECLIHSSLHSKWHNWDWV
jgi:hypothetical protein